MRRRNLEEKTYLCQHKVKSDKYFIIIYILTLNSIYFLFVFASSFVHFCINVFLLFLALLLLNHFWLICFYFCKRKMGEGNKAPPSPPSAWFLPYRLFLVLLQLFSNNLRCCYECCFTSLFNYAFIIMLYCAKFSTSCGKWAKKCHLDLCGWSILL